MNFALFTRSHIRPWLEGFVPFFFKAGSQTLVAGSGTKIWRDSVTETYSVTEAYKEVPLELSNALLLKTREWQLINARVNKPSTVLQKKPKASGDRAYLDEVNGDLEKCLDRMSQMLFILKDKKDLDHPVAFASNTLYAMELHGQGDAATYKKLLFPILKNKAQNLHNEGIATAIWALGQMEEVDEGVVEALVDQAATKQFANELEFFNATRFRADEFKPAANNHFDESILLEPVRNLFFKDHIHAAELYEGLKQLSTKLDGKVGEKVTNLMSHLESTHDELKESYNAYKELTSGDVE